MNNNPLVSYTRGNDLSGTMEGAGGIGGLLARSSGYSSGTFTTHNFYFADGNGNIVYMLNSSQSMVASYRYDPFGNTISKSGTLADANVYRFSSKEIHVASGMYYYGYRFYVPNLQRWINRDPIGERDGINLFAFVHHNPVSITDSLGLTAHLWPFNDVIYNQSWYNVVIRGDWVEITTYNPGLGSSTSRPWSYWQLYSTLSHIPRLPIGTTVAITEPVTNHVLLPKHSSESDWKNGLTKIVDADALLSADVPIYQDQTCTSVVPVGKRVKVGFTMSLIVHNCPKGCKGVFYTGGSLEDAY